MISRWRLFLVLTVLGCLLRTSYGILRYRSDLTRSGDAFVRLWDHDALEHVLIAKALLEGKGYIVDEPPSGVTTPVRFIGQQAVFKAPFYELFLAGVFAVSGFSFKVLMPTQALLGGAVAGLIGVIALQVFRHPAAGWIAGLLACIHPILVNSASQPYNENLFFFLFVLSIWLFLEWIETQLWRWATSCGVATGLAALTRENALILLVAFAAALFFQFRFAKRTWIALAVILLTATVVVLPWTIRNYVEFKTFVPVASILGEDLSEGNNSCVGSESILTPYWAEGPCTAVNHERNIEMQKAKYAILPLALRRDRVSEHVAINFILHNPILYAKLSFRRLWTTLLPFDPRGNQRGLERIALSLYWLLVFPAGIIGCWLQFKHLETVMILLFSIIFLNLLSIAAVLYWSDLRFRIGIDLLVGCFAAPAYLRLLELLIDQRYKSDRILATASQ